MQGVEWNGAEYNECEAEEEELDFAPPPPPHSFPILSILFQSLESLDFRTYFSRPKSLY